MNFYVFHRCRKTAASVIAYLQKKIEFNLIIQLNVSENLSIQFLAISHLKLKNIFQVNNFFNIFDLS